MHLCDIIRYSVVEYCSLLPTAEEPAEPGEPTEPAEPAEPAVPCGLAEPSEPAEPAGPAEPASTIAQSSQHHKEAWGALVEAIRRCSDCISEFRDITHPSSGLAR